MTLVVFGVMALAVTARGLGRTAVFRRGRFVAPTVGKLAMSSKGDAPAATVSPYDHLAVEKKWQDYWDANNVFVAKRRRGHPKKYVLDMFPYPSGSGLHVGHPEGYTATDIMARYWRMCDFDVLHPMGWDAFGLPAEQHAINTGTHPAVTTYQNIATFKRQLKSLGFSYDWCVWWLQCMCNGPVAHLHLPPLHLRSLPPTLQGAGRSRRPTTTTCAGRNGSSCNSTKLVLHGKAR